MLKQNCWVHCGPLIAEVVNVMFFETSICGHLMLHSCPTILDALDHLCSHLSVSLGFSLVPSIGQVGCGAHHLCPAGYRRVHPKDWRRRFDPRVLMRF